MSRNNFPWRSLNTKVTLFTLVVFVISMWSLAFYASRMLRENVQHLLGEQQFSTISLVAAQIDQNVDERLRALQEIAGSLGPEILGNAAAMQSNLEQRVVLQRLFNGGMLATRIDGTAIADVPVSAGRIGVNFSDRDFMVAVIKEGRATIGRPVMGKVQKAPVFSMAAPIRDKQGSVIGALVGVTNLGIPNFLDKIAENPYGKTGGYLVVSPQHRLIVTATDKRRIMEVLPANGVSPLIDRFIRGYEGSAVLMNPLGEQVLASAKVFPPRVGTPSPRCPRPRPLMRST
ncbi:MAG: cache domain-containing protein [Betaproteobacteria bacterium]|nr:cache domain-containing protein [Betaproteobacteria bacterium]